MDITHVCISQDKFNAKGKSLLLRTHCQTSGYSLTEQVHTLQYHVILSYTEQFVDTMHRYEIIPNTIIVWMMWDV